MRVRAAILPLAFTLVAAFQHQLFAFFPRLPLGDTGWDLSWTAFFFGYGLVAPVVLLSLVGGGLTKALDDLGLTQSAGPALLFGIVVTSPVLVGFGMTAPVNPALAFPEVVLGGVFFPFIEEVFFRGFLFGQLCRRAGWDFWPAALMSAAVFALAHLAQSQDPQEIAAIVAITGFGSIIFSYVFVQWGGNIWAPIACHALLNMWWSVFAVDDTALGDAFANMLRFGAIALAIGYCYVAPRFGWLKPLALGEEREREVGDRA